MSGNEVTILRPEEQLALATARSLTSRRQAVGVNVATVLVATIDRLSQSAPRRSRHWLTEKAERALDGES